MIRERVKATLDPVLKRLETLDDPRPALNHEFAHLEVELTNAFMDEARALVMAAEDDIVTHDSEAVIQGDLSFQA